VAAAGLIAVLISAGSSGTGHHVTGTNAVSGKYLKDLGNGNCDNTKPGSTSREGSRIYLYDANEHLVASGTFSNGTFDADQATCTFAFDFGTIEIGTSAYYVGVGSDDADRIKYLATELADDDYRIDINTTSGI
jgi:hypothetical protein